ncbi:MAG: glycosyltransferase family 4 protein [Acidobacteriota bacterium]
MSKPPDAQRPKALLLTPEAPGLGLGGGGLRIECMRQYLRQRYDVTVLTFDLPVHSKSTVAKTLRNAGRLLRGRPPLFDRFSGQEAQLIPQLEGLAYDVGVIEHFWCASYLPLLKQHCARVVIDLHNIESELARTHAASLKGPKAWAQARFAGMYRDLEREWLPQFDSVLVTSEADRSRIAGFAQDVRVFPNAIPEVNLPQGIAEQDVIAFSGNLEYHPNVEAVRWFRQEIWPLLREQFPALKWRLVGRNPEAILHLVKGDSRIQLIGPVADAVAALAEAKLCMVPLRSGSGTRFKILEAWAANRAVVSTTLGAEGLGAIDGEHLLIADNARSFADAVGRLLSDPELRTRLGAAGRTHYEEHFTWKAAWRALDEAGGI